VRRRDFIQFVAGTAAAFRPLAVRAQQKVPMRHIGIPLYAKQEKATINPVLQGLEQLGY
jgi:hypothetical protein